MIEHKDQEAQGGAAQLALLLLNLTCIVYISFSQKIIQFYTVLLQNQLCRDLRAFGVKFLSWKWCRCPKIQR